MLKVRLKRLGRKKYPIYRVVLMESSTKRDGKTIEEFGFYNPITKDYKLNFERINYRLMQGAKPTKTVFNLLKRKNVA